MMSKKSGQSCLKKKYLASALMSLRTFYCKRRLPVLQDLKPSTSTKAKLERKKCLAHFRREFLKLWYTHNEFTTYAIQFLKDHSEVLVGWTVRDIHLTEADQSAFLKMKILQLNLIHTVALGRRQKFIPDSAAYVQKY